MVVAALAQVIADENQVYFWQAGKGSNQYELTLTNDFQNKLSGNDSLKIYVNGTGNMDIGHTYESPQNFSPFGVFSMDISGANTTKDVVITFHTARWHDYYYTSLKDNFTGWQTVRIPLDEFAASGNPSWSNIIYIEILFENRVATYYIDQIGLAYPIGLEGKLPPIKTNSETIQMTISVEEVNMNYPVRITLSSPNGETAQIMADGVNVIKLRSELLKDGAILEIAYPAISCREELNIYYLTILKS